MIYIIHKCELQIQKSNLVENNGRELKLSERRNTQKRTTIEGEKLALIIGEAKALTLKKTTITNHQNAQTHCTINL